MSQPTIGIAGRLAAALLHSKLTPLAILASLLLGVYAVVALPREEEPQIIVPMVDVFVEMPGASPTEIEQRVTRPLEQLLWEIPGVEYVYSTSSQGHALVIVRFLVGQDEERALVRLNQKLASNANVIPPGASAPVVKARSIDDVPIMALTLWGRGYDDVTLRELGLHLQEALKEIPDIAEIDVIGGRPRQISIELDPPALAARRLDPLLVWQQLQAANTRSGTLRVVNANTSARVETGRWLESLEDVRGMIVGHVANAPVYLSDVARVTSGGGEPTSYVMQHPGKGEAYPAVTLSIAKRKGTNATELARTVERKLETVRGYLLPADVAVSVTRNYGETAERKSNELLWHMLLAVVSVSLLIWFVLGLRESAVVLTAIPVTLALTLFVFYLYGYTLNRITLFALIFSIGILVDDAIVVVENIVRHARLAGTSNIEDVAVRAVDEVGNPTILATLAVIAAILPMAFVGGLMGPYMRPIPIGASAAMIFSLLVAFVVTPWSAVRLLGAAHRHGHTEPVEDRFTAIYRRVMTRLITVPSARWTFFGVVALLLVAAVALVPTGLVTVKMLPFDNKSELQVVVHMPEQTPLETTAGITTALADTVLADPAVGSVQSYAGTSSPYTFNGLVRHYFLRQDANMADLQVVLVDPDERSEQSHEIAKRLRTALGPVALRLGATIQVVEVPPGPPVLQTIVGEVYGPDATRRRQLAQQVRQVFERTAGVVDVDWYVESDRSKWEMTLDTERAASAGVTAADLSAVAAMAGSGATAGILHDADTREAIPIVMRLPRSDRGSLDTVGGIQIGGGTAAVRDVVSVTEGREEQSVYHKNLLPVTYVTADVAGVVESPVYAILQMNKALSQIRFPEGYGLEIFNARQPFDSTRYAMKWDGEWHITYEVFRDLGIAFAAVLVLIYILVVGWFQSFWTPLTIMLAIPFSLVGILPAHAAFGAFFTATSMIGFIAGAGIVVRNSIILVDFIELRLQEGMPLEEAVVDAGAVRFRPMAMTAAAVIVGSAVILFDPIFQGLAISLMAGEVASLLLSRGTVPVAYYLTHRGRVAR